MKWTNSELGFPPPKKKVCHTFAKQKEKCDIIVRS